MDEAAHAEIVEINKLIDKIITEKFLPYHVFKYAYKELNPICYNRHYYHAVYSRYCVRHRKLYGGTP